MKAFNEYTLITGNRNEKTSITGGSTASHETGFVLEGGTIMLDCGLKMDKRPSWILITHGHLDHVKALWGFMLGHEQNKSRDRPLNIVCPVALVGKLRRMIDIGFRTTKNIALGSSCDALLGDLERIIAEFECHGHGDDHSDHGCGAHHHEPKWTAAELMVILRNIVKTHRRQDPLMALPPHNIIGVTIGRSDCWMLFDAAGKNQTIAGFESTTFPYTKAHLDAAKAARRKKRPQRRSGGGDAGSQSSDDEAPLAPPYTPVVSPEDHPHYDTLEDFMEGNSGLVETMNSPVVVKTVRCNHAGQPTTGYALYKVNKKLKPNIVVRDPRMKPEALQARIDQVKAAGHTPVFISSTDLKKAKASGEISKYKQLRLISWVAYMLDTDHHAFRSEGKHEGDKLDDCKCIITECTFYDPRDLKKAKNDGHMHWKHMKQIIDANPDKQYALTHFSARYTVHDMAKWQREIDRLYPVPKGAPPRVILMYTHPEHVAGVSDAQAAEEMHKRKKVLRLPKESKVIADHDQPPAIPPPLHQRTRVHASEMEMTSILTRVAELIAHGTKRSAIMSALDALENGVGG